jgi:antitoxin component of MazEF toxin-antitoxin module
MPITRKIQKIGNSKGVILTSEMLAHLGVEDRITITYEADRIVLTAPAPGAKLTPGRNRQRKQEAMRSTLAQYENALQRLAEPPAAHSDED